MPLLTDGQKWDREKWEKATTQRRLPPVRTAIHLMLMLLVSGATAEVEKRVVLDKRGAELGVKIDVSSGNGMIRPG